MFTMKFVSVLLCIICLNYTFGSKLNVPRVLLPVFDTFTVNFNIEVTDDGCYKWSIFRGDNVIKLVPLDMNPTLECSSKASVSSLSNEKVRQIAIIFAEDAITGETIRCDVIVDTIASLQIVTKTRELFVGDAPELFEVSAFDDQGNQFTSLDGVEFQWSIKVLKSSINTVLKFIPFKDSSYRTPPDLYELDQKNRQGHMVLVEGVKTGLALVSVKLFLYDEPTTQVELSVIANLRLEPSYVAILPGDLIQIDIYQIQNEKLVKIKLPSNQYSIEMDPSSTIDSLKIENDSGLFRGLKSGQIRLNLIDYHAESKNDTIPKSISSFISVSKIDYLSIIVKPCNRHNLIINGLYELEVHLFNNHNQSINIGSNVKIVMNLPKEYFKILNMASNGTYAIVQPIKLGTPKIDATLIEPYHDFKSSAQTTVTIYSKVKVTPNVIIFPWHAKQNNGLQFLLEATGGDKKYSWNSNDLTTSTVSSTGLVTVQGLGKTYISATMTRDSLNKDGANIYVLSPDNLKIIGQPVEQEVGKHIILYMQLFVKIPNHEEEISITTCNHNQFKIEIEDSQFTIKHNVDSYLNNSCAAFSISSESVGSTKVTVSFHTINTILKATVVVSTYKKLVPLRPEAKRTILAPGCSTTLLFYGGPQPWLGHSVGYKVEFEIDENLVTFKELSVVRDVDGHKTYAYLITCESFGSTQANLTIKSIPIGNEMKLETIAQTSVEVLCASPKFVKVFVADNEENCPISKSSNHIFAYIYEKLFVQINVIDEDGNIFDNATMINASWVIADPDLVRVVTSLGLNEKTEYGFSFPNYHYSILEPLNKEGSTEAVYQLTGYKKPFVIPNNSRFSSFLTPNNELLEIIPKIKHSMSILLFDNPLLTYNEILVVYNPEITKSLYISQGSGYFRIHQSTQKVAKVSHTGGRQIDVTPLAPGDLVVNIRDICVKSKSVEATFKVRNIYRVELVTNTFVEIGQTIRAIVKLYDSEGHNLPILPGVVNIRPVIEVNSVLTIKPEPSLFEQKYQTEFSITGSSLGKTNIYFVADTYPIKDIRSPTASIQVYSQLLLSPKNLTLAVGSSYQLTITGGPHLECVFEFLPDDEQITKVSNVGIVKGLKIGTATITGMAVGADVLSGMKVIYSKDTITIRVIKLNNIKIEVPLLKLKVGEVMPAWVRGVPDVLSPIIIGTIQPSLIFHWTISSAGIVQIYDILENTGILVREQDRISVRIRAVKVGNTRISVTVSDPSTKVIFTNFIDITIYEELRLVSHDLLLNSLLVTPNTEFTLMTNKNKIAKQFFRLIGHSKNSIHTMSVDENSGIVRTTDELGHAHVSISSIEDFDIVQSLDVPVEVKRVNYVMINIETDINSKEPSQMSVLPSGMNLKLITSYHDEKGVQFKAVNSDLKYLASIQNKISMTPGNQKHIMDVSLFESGEIILKIWDDGVYHFKEDYIKFHVEHLIYPNKAAVTVGDVICFLMPVKFNEEDSSKWLSDNIKTLAIDSSSGLGVAMAPSEVFVTYSNNKFTTSTSINILPIKTIIILPISKKILSNSDIVDIPLILLNEQESISLIKNKKGNMWEWRDDDCSNRENTIKRFPFICDVHFESILSNQVKTPSISRVFNVSPHFNTKTGFYSCQLTPITIIDQELSLFQAKIVIQVSADGIFTEQRDITFLPSVFIDKKELFFGQFSGKDKLTLIGLAKVLSQIEVTSSNDSLVLPILSSENENEKVYLFNVNDDFWNAKHFNLHIFVTSNLTDQTVKIPVVTSRSLNENDFSRVKLSNDHQQNTKKIQQSTIFSIFSGFSNSIFSNPYIISLVIIIITSLVVYCYGFSLNNRYIPLIKSPQTPPSPTNVGFYNRSSSSDRNSRARSLGLNRSLIRMN
ncbi:Invasin/intimin cell-adhesion fragments,Bacterial Ig-like, group 2 [Cinara cedri]|uniref:Invasin/intimin cell-adhesions,Bacterial Ig-like, group 2 n=1 Tax=Cinara cedri TaxID=506608 RepID=A0A5E4N0E0_9HEMI|nr:Invasin/intimin cell-adhesion fragments,Bacterial Ig-like, group 2 [Cinara cedri]